MGKAGYKEKYLKYVGEYSTNHFSCEDCPAKLFNTTKYIYEGIGNINSSTIIIYPTYVSSNKKLFDDLTDIINNNYNIKYSVNALSNIYITPVIKCFYNSSYDIKNKVLNKCAIKTISEIVRHKVHYKIIFLGDSRLIDMYLPDFDFKIHYIDCPYYIFSDDIAKGKFIEELLSIL